MVKITLTGDVPSKKNSRKHFSIGKHIVCNPSTNYEKWHKATLPQLLGKRPVKGQIELVELVIYPSTLRKSDLGNKAESIMDLLVDAGIIEDDNWFVVPELNLKFGGQDKENPRCEVNIYDV